MRLGILTATITECDFFPNIIELKIIGERKGHKVDLFKNGEFNLIVDTNSTKLYYNGKPFDPSCYDIILNRLSVREKSNAEYYVVDEFLKAGVPVINSPDSIMKARNKLLSLQIMSSLGINITRSAIIRRPEDIDTILKEFSFPLIIKNIFGSLGSSTLLVYDTKQLISTIDYIWNVNRNEIFLIQDFIKSDDDTVSDFRVFVLGNEIIASMKRTNSDRDFRANYKKGAHVKKADLTIQEKEQCLLISKSFGLEIAGVDFIRTKDGPVFLEVNSNPGLDGIRLATKTEGFDILEKIIVRLDHLKMKK
ncbi:MAG: RimK family alpha-L-glutamate ligase [Candidatus Delongbacteria bacterium]|nr:RimK family alpha-L-glutamate ligase [Candidatus Delongbacteria bacterium]MCG2761145.1 RimK family alpha-L-glutamate ligase [Candidatus Delongbacteria bacterium]